MSKLYVGIGSRTTPKHICDQMTKFAQKMHDCGYVLRSGGAESADSAFERGAGLKEIFLPWRNFNNNPSKLYSYGEECFKLAAKYHPNYEKLSWPVKKLLARNMCQVLGLDLNTPSDFLVYWSSHTIEDILNPNKMTGGTSYAVRVANDYGIPILRIEE